MSDRTALLAAICANPDDDSARLIYADWLDEHGESKRADFIRAKVEQHRAESAETEANAVFQYLDRIGNDWLARVRWAKVDAELAARVAAQKKFEKLRWPGGEDDRVPEVPGVWVGGWERGFENEAAAYNPDAFLASAEAIFRATPVTHVRFQSLDARQARQFAAGGYLARCRELEVQEGVEPEAIRFLGNHRDAAGVKSLELGGGVTTGQLAALAAGRRWGGVEAFELTSLGEPGADVDELDEEVVEAVAELFRAAPFRRLRRLVAWGSGAGDEAAEAIAKNFPELRHLDLALNGVGEDGAIAIAESKSLRHLQYLDLSSCELGYSSLAGALINSPKLPALRVLNLDNNYLLGPDVESLAGPGRGPGLRVLEVGDGELTAEGLEALARCPAVRGLWWLSLECANIDDEMLERFLRHADFERLTCLKLSFNQITARGAKALAAWPGAASLQWLDVGGNKIGVAGAKALAASPHLSKLRFVHADGRGTAALKERFGKAFG
jgi:uncharacterized protein (TIGR02996 family)